MKIYDLFMWLVGVVKFPPRFLGNHLFTSTYLKQIVIILYRLTTHIFVITTKKLSTLCGRSSLENVLGVTGTVLQKYKLNVAIKQM